VDFQGAVPDVSPVETWIATMQRRGDGAPSIVRASAVLSAILQRALVSDLVDVNAARAARKPRQALRASWQTVDRARLAELAAPRVATGGEGCRPR
jgi:hypothetical protein